MQKNKIAFLDYSYIFSGAENSLSSLIKYIDKDNFEPQIYFQFPMEHHHRYSNLDCKKFYLFDNKKWWMGSDRWKNPIRGSDFLKRFIFASKLAYSVKKENIDILHINLLHNNSFFYIWIPKLFGIKIIGHSRSDTMEWIPSAQMQKKCSAIICVSDFVKDKVLSKYEFSPAYTVYNPVDYNNYNDGMTKEEALKSLEIPPGKKLLSSVGLLSFNKGHDMAIKVFASISKKNPQFILIIAGGGNDKELKRLKELTIEKGIENRVIFTEKQIANIDTVYRASDIIFSLTTRGEAFGRVPFEGSACDTAVIAPTKGAAIELITDKETGFLVDPLDEEAIISKTIYILEHPEETQKIVEEGKSYFSQKLSPLNSAKKVEDNYRKILNQDI